MNDARPANAPDLYAAFLDAKAVRDPATGLADPPPLHVRLADFQRDIVRWTLRRGRAAVFAGTGLGKTWIELAAADALVRATGRDALILTPLAVAPQIVDEGAGKLGIAVRQVRDKAEVRPGISVANFEREPALDIARFGAVIVDESSILKAADGATRTRLIERCRQVPFRIAATATPAPNDWMELGNHAEFLGVCSYTDMLARFFTHDGGETQKWRLKGHAEAAFWSWMCSWSVMLRHPRDLGYATPGYDLPPLRRHLHVVEAGGPPPPGLLMIPDAATLQERLAARRETVDDRAALAASITPADQPFVWWCNLNAEAEALTRRIPGAVEVRGSDPAGDKEAKLRDFAAGRIRGLVTKPSICGFGMNWQHCRWTGFVGLNDSFEQVYQAIRRFWRFGQLHAVDAHFVASSREGAVLANQQRKEADFERMQAGMIAHMADLNAADLRSAERAVPAYRPTQPVALPGWLAA